MDDGELLIPKLICLVILVFLSAFFSGAEAALFSLSRLKLKQLGDPGKKIGKLLHVPRHLLTILLIGTTLVNVSASALGTTISIHIFRKMGMEEAVGAGVAIGVMTLLILFFGEIIPITIGVARASTLAPIVTPLVKFFVFVLSPLRIILGGITNLVVTLIERHKFFTKEPSELTDEEIKTMVDLGRKEGVLQEHERRMIHSIFEFGDTIVSQVMVPRERMACVKLDTLMKDVLKLIKATGYSRMPVYKESLDDVVGTINAKDFLSHFSTWEGDKEVIPRVLIRRPYFVSGTMKVNELLRQFQRRKVQMAIVRDRHQTIIGLVTLEDLVEEIVGEIHDEYEKGKPL